MVKKPCDVEPGRVGGLDKSLDVMGGGKVDGFHPYPEGQEACSEAVCGPGTGEIWVAVKVGSSGCGSCE